MSIKSFKEILNVILNNPVCYTNSLELAEVKQYGGDLKVWTPDQCPDCCREAPGSVKLFSDAQLQKLQNLLDLCETLENT